MEIAAKRLTEQFYAWEKRGRGTLLTEQPCELEPHFHPFFHHYVPTPYIDDGRKPTILSSIADIFRGKKKHTVPTPEYHEPEIIPYLFTDTTLHAYTIVLPKGYKTPAEQTTQLLIMLAHCSMPLSYEIYATATNISIHLVCRIEDCAFIRGQCKAYFPEVTVHDNAAYLEQVIGEHSLAAIMDFTLSEEFTRPIQTPKGFDLDPYIPFFGVIEQLQQGESVVLQVQFTAAINPWSESVLRAVSTHKGDCFFLDAPEMLPLAKEKISMPLFAVTVKVGIEAQSDGRLDGLIYGLSKTIATITRSPSNCLRLADDDVYTFEERFDDLRLRQSHRLGMLLNVRELATLVHFPSHSVHSDKLIRSVTRTKAAPAFAQGHPFVLGKNIHQNKETIVSIPESQRMRHMHVIGATGTGKSTLLLNLIHQDITFGNGLAILDPHGDLIESILTFIPESRKNDVVIIDPFDSEYPVASNILHAKTDIEKELISSDLVALFRRFSTSWGDQMNSVFANAILAFVESSQGGTLGDLRRFLIEKSYRDSFMQTVQDEEIIYYWQKEFPLLKSSSIGPILTKLDAFLRPRVIRNMVNQKQSLPIAEFMDSKKIVLIKLSQGLIGAENSYLLGALLVSKIHQAAMARQLQSKDTRIPFYLYIDEFQHFITPSMSDILSGARKFQLGLVLAHQSMEQVSKYDSELAHSLLANAGTRICFRLGNADAKKMEEGLSYFSADDLQNLSVGEAICRINRAEDDFSLKVEQQKFTSPPQPVRDYIIKQSRQKYASRVEQLKQKETIIEEPQPKPEVPKQPPATDNTSRSDLKETNKRSAKEEKKDNNSEQQNKKEETEHRSLQNLIKLMGQNRGFKANLEVPIDTGKVDVILEKGNIRIACEVSVTTDIAWELHNVQKCFNHSFTIIASVSKNEKFLIGMRKKIAENYSEAEQKRILALSPDKLFEFLEEFDQPKDEIIPINGYRVKPNYNTVSDSSKKSKIDLLKNIVSRNKK